MGEELFDAMAGLVPFSRVIIELNEGEIGDGIVGVDLEDGVCGGSDEFVVVDIDGAFQEVFEEFEARVGVEAEALHGAPNESNGGHGLVEFGEDLSEDEALFEVDGIESVCIFVDDVSGEVFVVENEDEGERLLEEQ